MVWYTLFDRPSATTGNDQNGNNIRQAIPVAAYALGAPPTGTQLRVTWRAAVSGNLNISSAYIGHSPTGDPFDFDTTQVQLPGPTFSIPAGTNLTTAGATYSFNKTKPLTLSAQITFPGQILSVDDPLVSFGFCSGGVSASDVTAASVQSKVAFPKVEVFFTDPGGNAVCTLTRHSTTTDPTSAPSVKFLVEFNKGVTGLTPGDIDLSSSTVAWVGGAPVVSITGSDFFYLITVTGMLTLGNVVARIPAAAVTAVADGLPNNASGTVSVNWDPDILGPGANVYDITAVTRDILRFEIRDPAVPFGHFERGAPLTGAGTYPVTNVVNNGYGGIRITTTAAPNYHNIFIQNMTAGPGGVIRCQVYDTTGLGSFLYIQNALGTTEANSSWNVTFIDSTHFDLIGSTFVNTYLGNGYIWITDSYLEKATLHSIGGTVEANRCFMMMRSGTNTLDLLDSEFVNTYTSGGTLCTIYRAFEYPNPTLGGALDICEIVGHKGNVLRFLDRAITPEQYLDRLAIMVSANYSMTGGYTVTKVYRKTKPWNTGAIPKAAYQLPITSFRHYIYLQLSGNLVNGTYTIQFPVATGLPPKTFTYNDKQTRCSAIHVDQNGHRPGDQGKLAYLSQWIPEKGTGGEVQYSGVTAWHLINDAGTVVATFGAPVQRVTPTTNEGASYAPPDGISEPTAQGPYLIMSNGPPIKVTNITFATNALVTVTDASSLNNGDMIAFSDMYHSASATRQAATTAAYPNPGPGSPDQGRGTSGNPIVNHVGMWQIETDSASTPLYYRVINKSGNTFNLGCVKGVAQGGATVASGGSGYAIGDWIIVNNTNEFVGVALEVTSVSGSAITGVRVVPNEEYYWFRYPFVINPIHNSDPAQKWASFSSGKIDYPYTIPTNPRPQMRAITGTGSGATFNLTWTNNPWDRTTYYARGTFPAGNPNTTVRGPVGNTLASYPPQAFDVSVVGDQGNKVYRVNETENRTGTYVYGLDFSSFTTSGDYRIWIPNIGVSDPIHLNNDRYWRASKQYLKGLYHQRQGCVLDGRFGYTRPAGHKDCVIYRSYMPYCFSNYSLEPVGPANIGDVNQSHYTGGGIGNWLRGADTGTRLRMHGFGSHQDGGDWDVRLNETAWGYYQILDAWEHSGTASKLSLTNQGTPTCLEAGLDPTIFAGTNSLPSPLVEVIWGIEPQRSSQEVGGGVGGGINYGEGTLNFDTADNNSHQWYSWYPDPIITLNYVFVAAKLARQLYNFGGFTSLADHYKNSAIAAYNWAVSIVTNTSVRDAWFAPVKLRAKWDTTTYDACMASLISKSAREQRNAAAALFSLTGNTAYKTVFDAGGELTAVDVREAFGHWEYANAPGATESIRDATFHAYRQKALNFVLNSEAPDVSYCYGQQRGIWNMAYGGGNDWILSTPTLTFGAVAFEKETPPNTADADRCRAALRRMISWRHGANQLGLCICNGLGVRHNLESLHKDSRNLSQPLPIAGLASEGPCNLFPIMFTHGDSFINFIQHPEYEPAPETMDPDPTVPYHELYPFNMLCWPRFEYFMEIYIAIEHSEFTTQQQLLPAYAATMYLHGFDGNDATGGLAVATVLLTSSVNPSNVGASVTFTCNISGASGTPTGNVSFTSDGASLGTVTLSSGVAQVTTSALTAGSHAISVSYGGDSIYDPNGSTLIQDVIVLATEFKISPRLAMRLRAHA